MRMWVRPVHRILAVAAAVLLAAAEAEASAPPPSTGAAPPDTAFLTRYALTQRFRAGRPASITVSPDGRTALFLRSGPRDLVRDLYETDLATGEERRLLSAQDILQGAEEALSPKERARRERLRLTARGIAGYELSKDGAQILAPLSDRLYLVDRASGAVRELPGAPGYPYDPQFSPDGTKIAYVRDGNLWVLDPASGQERRLTDGAGPDQSFGTPEFVAQEEMDRRHGYWWSPDSRRIAYQRTETSAVEHLSIMDPARPEIPPETWPYPRAGTVNATVTLGVISADGGETTWIRWDRERYEYLAVVSWEERAPLTLLVQNRAQTEETLLAADPETGGTRPLLTERDPAWLNLFDGMPAWLPDGTGFLWMTERDGARRLELRDRDGALLHAVTGPDFHLQGFEHLLPETREVVVSGAPDPVEARLYRVPLDPSGGDPVPLSPGRGVFSVVSEGRGERFAVSGETLDEGPRWEIADRDGPSGVRLRSVAEDPGLVPRLEITAVGEDPVYPAALVRPRDFDPGRRYPVIVDVYGGPGYLQVRDRPSAYLLDQWMADQGYVVVAVDGRGTPYRGRARERSLKGDLSTLPLHDQAAALRLLFAGYPELDSTRVGITGWSFGGTMSALAALRMPGLFRAGVAGAPVTDWRDYDTYYTERYMGLPAQNPAGYERADVLAHIAPDSSPLLVIHGTSDDNVYFLNSLKLTQALFRAGRPFEFLPLTGFTHMVPDPVVTKRLYARIMDFFAGHLTGD